LNLLMVSTTFARQMKFDDDHRFMQEFVFAELKKLNTGFDSPLIHHVSPSGLRRGDRSLRTPACSRVIGIEVFASDLDLLEVEISPESGLGWARRLGGYLNRPDVTFCATFDVPVSIHKPA
jgi:hypothetical protein